MKIRTATMAVCLLAIAGTMPASASPTTQEKIYVGVDMNFVFDEVCTEPANSNLPGIACFNVSGTGLETLDVEVRDLSRLDRPAYVEIYAPDGSQLTADGVCGTGRLNLNPDWTLARVVVHIEFVSQIECEAQVGPFYPSTGGRVFITY